MNTNTNLKEAVDRIAFYLSPSNISEDALLSQLVAQNEDGYIPLDVFLQFPDIKGFDISKDDLKNALLSTNSVQISPDGNAIRWNRLQDECNDEKKTCRLDGIPLTISYQTLQNAFSSFPEVDHIQMKKNVYTHQFTGVVYVVLKTIEDAEAFSKRSIEIDGIHISRNQLLTSYINGNAENNKRFEYFPGCLYILKDLPPTTTKDLEEYLIPILPSSADFVFESENNFCAIHYSDATDGLACLRTINNTPYHGVKITASKAQPRSKNHLWEKYLTLLKCKSS